MGPCFPIYFPRKFIKSQISHVTVLNESVSCLLGFCLSLQVSEQLLALLVRMKNGENTQKKPLVSHRSLMTRSLMNNYCLFHKKFSSQARFVAVPGKCGWRFLKIYKRKDFFFISLLYFSLLFVTIARFFLKKLGRISLTLRCQRPFFILKN